jgi:predicted membrane-bound spermidine synthase
VRVICADALEACAALPPGTSFDGVIVDLTDPGHPGLDEQDIPPILELAGRLIGDDGGMAIHAGSPFLHPGSAARRRAFAAATVGRASIAYLVEVPSFGGWSFCCAATRPLSLAAIGFPVIPLRA